MRISEAAAQVDAARLVYARDVAALDRLATEGKPLHAGAAERITYDVPFVVDACSRGGAQSLSRQRWKGALRCKPASAVLPGPFTR